MLTSSKTESKDREWGQAFKYTLQGHASCDLIFSSSFPPPIVCTTSDSTIKQGSSLIHFFEVSLIDPNHRAGRMT